MEIIGIIPSRYESSRFPGKPLADICGKTMIERVYRRACEALDTVIVATDDIRIADEVERFGGNVMMTSSELRSGTERCAAVVSMLERMPDAVINIQGDEPLIEPSDISLVKTSLECGSAPIATLARRFDPDDGFEALFSPDSPKVVMDAEMNALYFSRSIIPYVRDVPWQEWVRHTSYHIHVGLYGYRTDVLQKIASLPPADIELSESLEQLRWLHAGYRVKVMITENRPHGVDTPADIAGVVARLNGENRNILSKQK